MLLVIPVAIAGWRLGPRAAWAAVAAALVAVALKCRLATCDISAVAWLSGALVFATVALLAGALHAAMLPKPTPVPALPVEDILTSRELEILARMAEGKTNQEIAEGLVIAESTVKSHVKNILRKLGAANRAQAVYWYGAATRRTP
jgi:DNA-binding NarL/FixJ family response regulator